MHVDILGPKVPPLEAIHRTKVAHFSITREEVTPTRGFGTNARIILGLFQILESVTSQGYMFWPFLSKLKNREEFEGGLHEKREGKRWERKKKEKSDKTHVKISL